MVYEIHYFKLLLIDGVVGDTKFPSRLINNNTLRILIT